MAPSKAWQSRDNMATLGTFNNVADLPSTTQDLPPGLASACTRTTWPTYKHVMSETGERHCEAGDKHSTAVSKNCSTTLSAQQRKTAERDSTVTHTNDSIFTAENTVASAA